MQLDCGHGEEGGVDTCGESKELPCCHLQDVVNEMKEEDIIYLLKHSWSNDSDSKPWKVNIHVGKSITLKTASLQEKEEDRVQGVELQINSSCNKPCTLALISHFHYSKISVSNMNILIHNSTFTNSHVAFQ